ncbi:hypothetical protein Ddye_025465 [Dipteronia dyeriana]|uniref:Uncharacterized protein n=1 Tax=Dipteronia dyeriana TaxID=168575 RepID=A0AAD9TK98_9ROSI|nr:hypothetical protein Ddye_025465 [Dipteronia dyeriana]
MPEYLACSRRVGTLESCPWCSFADAARVTMVEGNADFALHGRASMMVQVLVKLNHQWVIILMLSWLPPSHLICLDAVSTPG